MRSLITGIVKSARPMTLSTLKFNFLFSNQLLRVSLCHFAKGGKDKKSKAEEEKKKIHDQYDQVSDTELRDKYKSQAENILNKFNTKISEIQVMRNSPRILDNVTVTLQNKKIKLSECATIITKSLNVFVVNPFDERTKDAVLKGLGSSKLDAQIENTGDGFTVTVGNMPNDVKKEQTVALKKLLDASKEEMKSVRHQLLGELKKLEKIIGKDEAKSLEKSLLDVVEKTNKQIESANRKKEEEIRSC